METLLARLYALLLRAMPDEVRSSCGSAMREDLEAALRHERRVRGNLAMWWAGCAALADLMRGVARERWIATHGYRWQRAGSRRADPGLGEWMMMWIREVRLALRALLRRPGFALVATLTLGLGIGATVAIFTVVNAVVLQPVPIEDSDRVVEIRHGAPAIDLPELNNSPGTVAFYRTTATAFEEIAVVSGGAANVTVGERTDQMPMRIVTPEFFSVFRVQPSVGRAFVDGDAPRDEGPPTGVILTQAGVDRLFAGDRAVLGRTLRVDGNSIEILGVMPETFTFPDAPDVRFLAPLYVDPQGPFGEFGLTAFARLAPGQTVASARAHLEELQTRLPEYDPEITQEMLDGFGWNVKVLTLKETIVGDTAALLWIVLGTVGFVLLIACANVANLFLVRAEARQKELGIRAALGAGRDRIAGTFLSESLVLGLMGGAVGMAVAWGGVEALLRWGPQDLPRMHEIGITLPVLAFAGAVSVASGLLLGAIPMVRYAGRGFSLMLRDGNRTSTDGRGRHRARNVLVVSQLALALVLLVGSGLMFRSLLAIRAVDLGFETENRLVVGMSVGQNVETLAAAQFYGGVIERVKALPGVVSAGFSSGVPLHRNNWSGGSFEVEGEERPENAPPRVMFYQPISAGYPDALGHRLVEGRAMSPREWQSGARVAWVNTYARDVLLDGRALGKRITWGASDDEDERIYAEIVGVYDNWKASDVTDEEGGIAFVPMVVPGWDYPELTSGELVVHTADGMSATSLVPAVRGIVADLDPSVPITQTLTMDEVVSRSLADRSITLVMLAIATGVAVFLGTIGLFGVISYVVGQRRREIGVRIALGAEAGTVSGLVVRQGIGVVVVGIAVGLVGAFFLTRVLDSVLYTGVSPTDPLTFGGASLLLLAVSLLATWLPARRAARIDPIEALRAE